jgi:guanosine-3',5'-bis(diphosphate) 3'-pyrophosphohydrolase
LVVKAIVAEVTNDLNLSRADRKRAQVRKAGCTSVRARLVKLADMIDNLTDLLKCKPPGWTSARLQGYFIWKRAVFDAGLSGFNEKLDDQAERLFGAVSMVDDDLDGDHHEWPVIPKGDTTDLLEAYYASFD